MEVKGLAWLGIRTTEFEDAARFFEDTLDCVPSTKSGTL